MLDADEVCDFLKEQGVAELYHANSVTTSCVYLMNGGLMSRKCVEARDLPQTFQSSDQIDKKFGIWNDIFLDGVDIHVRAKNRIVYGPVLFVVDVDILLDGGIECMNISRRNPHYWEYLPQNMRYFASVDDLRQGYDKFNFGMSLMIRNIDGFLPFSGRLKTIIVDDPRLTMDDIDLFGRSFGSLEFSSAIGKNVKVQIMRRKCLPGCRCLSTYERLSDDEIERFFIAHVEVDDLPF